MGGTSGNREQVSIKMAVVRGWLLGNNLVRNFYSLNVQAEVVEAIAAFY